MEISSCRIINRKLAIPDKYLKMYSWLAPLEKTIRENLVAESSGHDFYHALRVLNLCLSIADEEYLDLEVLIAASLLHDIARHEEQSLHKQSNYHIKKGVATAEKLLKRVNFPKSKINLVKICVREHEAEGSSLKESQILQDADKLDAMGAIGIARCFTYGGKINRPIWRPTGIMEIWKPGVRNSSSIAHIFARILSLSHKMNTTKGKEMAKTRLQFTLHFIDQFKRELEGGSSFDS